MNAPKKRQSDERNSHIASFVLPIPVWVSWATWATAPPVGVATTSPAPNSPGVCSPVCSIVAIVLRLLRRGLEAPRMDPEEQEQEPGDDEIDVLEHGRVSEEWQS